MDAYKYLLKKLGATLLHKSDVGVFDLILDDPQHGKIRVDGSIPDFWTTEDIFRYYRTLDPDSMFRFNNQPLDRFCQQLQQFPDELESIEHVDLLLAVNGMNIGA